MLSAIQLNRIADLFNETLPGEQAQFKMAPENRKVFQIKSELKPVQAAVLVLLYPSDKNDELCIPLIKRASDSSVHSKQISFPGGKCEPQDNDVVATALREAKEEIGIIPQKINVVGTLSNLYIPPSNFNVTPIVGYSLTEPVFKPDISEVERILKIPLQFFIDDENKTTATLFAGNPKVEIECPAWIYDGEIIWGATAMILSELIEVLKRKSW